MQQLTLRVIKWIALFILLALALLCYSMGTMSGFIALIVVGLLFEAAFWLFGARLFSRKKPNQQTSQTS
ncbi:hypothetical protein NH514_12600 [Pseudoalteromonas sp. ACER1]|jgi:hypothetical protein|uniref:hypothetical protein n=1 Tax=unclassified Pseudoalteromonas TaxID=194690 RepID=UPI00110B73D0|nr:MULTISPECIES: hypothetical protein [unclassified Pseudoalteromonas]MEC8226052.1 hypothetical protein [Pseudomonadota bacterium]MBC7009626.1 hypothetical protein [Pseudoalteromonas sp. BZK2]MCF2847947.1 hypothetical protein [Pseudoalteromonas sp. PAST1]MCO7211576.1 hypothetical protein [Pseudoalteromonas sp. ACER1]MED5513580.1 hypothetical protein [Pseudomonadota bacterium]